MKEKIIIKRYAEAFLGYARKTIGLDRALQELKFIRQVVRESQDFMDFLNNQEIPRAEKFDFLDRVFKDALSEETRNFMKLLLDKGRIALLTEIANYARVNYAHGEAVDALFKTTLPLDLGLLEEIKKNSGSQFDPKVAAAFLRVVARKDIRSMLEKELYGNS